MNRVRTAVGADMAYRRGHTAFGGAGSMDSLCIILLSG